MEIVEVEENVVVQTRPDKAYQPRAQRWSRLKKEG